MKRNRRDAKNKKTIRLPRIGKRGLGEEVYFSDKNQFGEVIAKMNSELKGDRVSHYRLKEVGTFEEMQYDGKDLRFYCKSDGLLKFTKTMDNIQKENSPGKFLWFEVRGLNRIKLTGPGWGAAVFGSVALFAEFVGGDESSSSAERHGLQFAGRINGSTIGLRGASPKLPSS